MSENKELFLQAKRMLYAMRNGIVADALRRGGCKRRLIWGVNLPQLSEIAAALGPSADLSWQLLDDDSLRESILLAPMVFPVQELTFADAMRFCEAVRWSEEADVLCFKLLRKAPFAVALANELCADDDALRRYTGLRLWLNISGAHPHEAYRAAKTELERTEPVALATEIIRMLGD